MFIGSFLRRGGSRFALRPIVSHAYVWKHTRALSSSEPQRCRFDIRTRRSMDRSTPPPVRPFARERGRESVRLSVRASVREPACECFTPVPLIQPLRGGAWN